MRAVFVHGATSHRRRANWITRLGHGSAARAGCGRGPATSAPNRSPPSGRTANYQLNDWVIVVTKHGSEGGLCGIVRRMEEVRAARLGGQTSRLRPISGSESGERRHGRHFTTNGTHSVSHVIARAASPPLPAAALLRFQRGGSERDDSDRPRPPTQQSETAHFPT